MRILHIAPGEPFGGVQRIVLDLADAQAERHKVAVLWTGSAERAMAHAATGRAEAFNANGSVIGRMLSASEFIRNFDPDILHMHMPPPWLALLPGIGARASCFHLHGLPGRKKGLRAIASSLLERRLVTGADALIGISSWVSKAWRERFPDATCHRVFNGIALDPASQLQPAGVSADRPVIGFGSRLSLGKGVAEFAEAALAIGRKLPSARFIVAGDGPERFVLEDRLAGPITDGTVTLLGHIEDMPAFWRRLDVALFCAPRDSFGLTLIEPVAEGVPVIAYETGAGSDEIARDCAGIATVPYDDAEAMADLALAVLRDPGRRERMVGEGRADIARLFSIAAMTDGIEAVYLDMLRAGAGAAK